MGKFTSPKTKLTILTPEEEAGMDQRHAPDYTPGQQDQDPAQDGPEPDYRMTESEFVHDNIATVAQAFIAKQGDYWKPDRVAEEALKYTVALAERLKKDGHLS